MTYQQFVMARLLIAEERFGAPVRSHQRAEDAKVEATKAAIRKHMKVA